MKLAVKLCLRLLGFRYTTLLYPILMRVCSLIGYVPMFTSFWGMFPKGLFLYVAVFLVSCLLVWNTHILGRCCVSVF